jgi:chemotaxis response regulator CheB
MTEKKSIRVLVVDDHAVVRQGIGAVLDPRHDLVLIGEASNGSEAVEKTIELEPDIILMDLIMPTMNGIEATLKIKKLTPTLGS